MNLFKLGFRNIGRNRRRTIINASTICCAVLVIILFDVLIEGQWIDVVDNYVKMGLGHVKIHKEGYDRESERLPLDMLIDNSDEIAGGILSLKEIKGVYPRLISGGIISFMSKQSPLVLNGVDILKESKIGFITEKNVDGDIPRNGEYRILLGRKLATLLNLSTGDIVFIYSRTSYGTHNVLDLEVSGIYSVGFSDYESRNAFVPRDILQEFLGTSGVSEITIMLKEHTRVDIVRDTVENIFADYRIEIFPYYHFLPEIKEIMAMQKGSMAFIRMILLLIALFGILNIMMISAWERKKEIGTMRAIGYSRYQITRIFVYEGFWIGVIGSLMGCIIAFGAGILLENVGIPIPEGALVGMNIPMSTHIFGKMLFIFFIRGFFLGVITSVISSIPASLRAAFLPVMKALREY